MLLVLLWFTIVVLVVVGAFMLHPILGALALLVPIALIATWVRNENATQAEEEALWNLRFGRRYGATDTTDRGEQPEPSKAPRRSSDRTVAAFIIGMGALIAWAILVAS